MFGRVVQSQLLGPTPCFSRRESLIVEWHQVKDDKIAAMCSNIRKMRLPPENPARASTKLVYYSKRSFFYGSFYLDQVINKPVEQVFDTVIDVAKFPKWNPTTKSARQLTAGKIGQGTKFELEIKGYGKTLQELQEFEVNKRVRLVPHINAMEGGHRFLFTTQGNQTRVDHELEMTPEKFFKLLTPIMGMFSRKNLRATARALQNNLEHD